MVDNVRLSMCFFGPCSWLLVNSPWVRNYLQFCGLYPLALGPEVLALGIICNPSIGLQ